MRLLVRLNQKITTWMKVNEQKSAKPGNLVLDASTGTISVVNACLLLQKHRQFTGCEANPSFMTAAVSQLVQISARQWSSKKSDIGRNEEDRCSAEMYVR